MIFQKAIYKKYKGKIFSKYKQKRKCMCALKVFQ